MYPLIPIPKEEAEKNRLKNYAFLRTQVCDKCKTYKEDLMFLKMIKGYFYDCFSKNLPLSYLKQHSTHIMCLSCSSEENDLYLENKEHYQEGKSI
jgi:hypothetical protein